MKAHAALSNKKDDTKIICRYYYAIIVFADDRRLKTRKHLKTKKYLKAKKHL